MPNRTTGFAFRVFVGDEVSGRFAANSTEDHYFLSPLARGWITLTMGDLESSVDVFVVNGFTGAVENVGTVTSGGSVEFYVSSEVDTFFYFSRSDSADTSEFSFTTTIAEDFAPDELSPVAVVLPFGDAVSSSLDRATDVDFFQTRFQIGDTGSVDVSFEQRGDYTVELLSANGSVITSQQVTNATSINVGINASSSDFVDIVYVSVSSNSGEISDYSIVINSNSADANGNDRPETADLITIPASGQVTLIDSVGFGNDSVDYYLVNLEEVAVARIQLTGLSDDIDIDVFDALGELLDFSDNSGSSSEVVEGLFTPGQVLIAVYPYDTAASNYRLTLEIIGNGAGLSEATALPLPLDENGVFASSSIELGTELYYRVNPEEPGFFFLTLSEPLTVDWEFSLSNGFGLPVRLPDSSQTQYAVFVSDEPIIINFPPDHSNAPYDFSIEYRAYADLTLWAVGSERDDNFDLRLADVAATERSVLLGFGGNDTLATFGIFGDTLEGGDGNDYIGSFSGDDLLSGGAGRDTVYSSAGDDTVSGGGGDDTLVAGEGNDIVRGGPGGDLLEGERGFDVLFGQSGDDTLLGGGAQDILIGGEGADYIDGGPGADRLVYSASREGVSVNLATGIGAGGDADGDTLTNIDQLNGSTHDDFLVGNEKANRINGLGGDDSIIGADGNDILNGGSGRDTIVGGAGNDLINGQAGNDTLIGGIGNDTLFGRGGADVFAFSGDGLTTIGDYRSEQGDTLDFSAVGFTTLTEALTVARDTGDGLLFDFGDQGSVLVVGASLSDF